MRNKKVLLTTHSMMINIAKHLQDQDFEIHTADKGMSDTLNNLGIATKPMVDSLSGDIRELALTEAARLIHAAVEYNGYVELDDLSLQAQKFIPGFIYPRVADLCVFVMTLDKIKPDVIVVHNDVEPITRVFALWAKQNNVSCLHVPHAVYQDINRGPEGTDIHDMITASHLAAAGEFQSEWYQKRGFSKDNIRLTGLPQWDSWANVKYDRKRAFRLLKLDYNIPTVSYISTWKQTTNLLGCNDDWAHHYADFLEAIKKSEGKLQAIVKVHPNSTQDQLKWHIDMAKENNVHCLITPLYLDQVLLASDIVFAPYGSNVLIEASIMPHVRLATINGHGFADDDEVTKIEQGSDNLLETFLKLIDTEACNLHKFMIKYAGEMDGRASERVAAFIKDLANC